MSALSGLSGLSGDSAITGGPVVPVGPGQALQNESAVNLSDESGNDLFTES